jgi:Aspartyl protease/PDZ domain
MRKTNATISIIFAANMVYATLALAAATTGEILDAYKAATGGRAWDDKITLSVEFTITGYGLTGRGHALSDLKDGRSQSEYTLGPTTAAEGYDGTNRWRKDMSGTVTEQQGGDARELAVNDAYRNSGKWWEPDRGGAQILDNGEKPFGDMTCEVLIITPKVGKAFEAWFDTGTGLLAKTVEKQGSQTATTTMSDYRRVDGIMLPYKIVVDMGHGEKYLRTTTVTKIEFLSRLPDSDYAPPKVTLTDFSIAGGAPQTEIPFHLINNHVFGAAQVNGKGPYFFIFDTGGTNVITLALAKSLNLDVEGSIPEFGAGEGVMEGSFARVAEIRVGDAVVKNQIFTVLPLDRLAATEGTPMPGLIGYEVFRRFVTRIDYGAETITLIDSKHFTPENAGTPVKFAFHDHILEVIGTFEGLAAKYNIDTGSRSELTLTKSFVDQGGLRTKHPKGVDAMVGWGVGGPTRAYVTRATEMTLGQIRIDNVVTNMSTQDRGGLSGFVGGGILKRFIITFDYEHQMMYLKPRPGPVADTGTFDRAGMWLNESPLGFEIVDVTKGSPAEQAGLKPSDTILAVDHWLVDKIHLYDLRQQLRDNAPGTVVIFRVQEGPGVKDVKVTLRDLI